MTTKNTDKNTQPTGMAPHEPARPMKTVVDGNGCNWLCDVGIDESGDLAAQGCWRCSEMAFTRDS